jgi:Tn3 transposase DDE domain-containing protein
MCENLHALRRSLAGAGAGALRRRHHEQQSERMWCLTLATNAIVWWSRGYHGLGVAALRPTRDRPGRIRDHEVIDRCSRVVGMSDVDDELDHQGMAIELIDAFAEHDATGLAALDPAGRAAQLQARQTFYNYVDRIWEGAKARGLDPASGPDWNAVAGLRDLANVLLEQAFQAQTDAGD